MDYAILSEPEIWLQRYLKAMVSRQNETTPRKYCAVHQLQRDDISQMGRCDVLTNGEHSVNLCELIALKIQIFFHTTDICIGEVATVELETQSIQDLAINGGNLHSLENTSDSRMSR